METIPTGKSRVHINPPLESLLGLDKLNRKTILENDIILNAGQYSRLVLELEQCISCPKWKQCMVELKRDSQSGWFTIETIF